MNILAGSFHERSTWIQLSGVLITAAVYSVWASQMMGEGETALLPYAIAFSVSVVLLVVAQIVGFILSAIFGDRNANADERDDLIEWRSESRSSWVMGAGIILALVAMFTQLPQLWVAHILLAALYLGTIAKLVLKLIAYRRGY